jgi:hypothetical protein
VKVFLDDLREAPSGWHRAYWPDEVVSLLKSGNVTHLSLDHDLGDDVRGTGYDVILWIEKAVVTADFKPPALIVHSRNSSARPRMLAGIRAIESRVRL